MAAMKPLPETAAQSRTISRAEVDVFREAYTNRDIETVAEFLDDDVEWTVSGPVDILPFSGIHRGKAAVLNLITRQIPKVLRVDRLEPQTALVDGNQAALLNRVIARHNGDGRAISYRLANFMRFRDCKIVKNLSFLDTFDAAEQVLGRSLAGENNSVGGGDLVAI
jgi:ketosteroid isomerase-like protein